MTRLTDAEKQAIFNDIVNPRPNYPVTVGFEEMSYNDKDVIYWHWYIPMKVGFLPSETSI